MKYNDFVVLSNDVECVLEWCSFFYHPDEKRIICVPDSMFSNFMDQYHNINKLVLLGNDPKILIAYSPFPEEAAKEDPEDDSVMESDVCIGFNYKGFVDEEYYYGEDGVNRYHE